MLQNPAPYTAKGRYSQPFATCPSAVSMGRVVVSSSSTTTSTFFGGSLGCRLSCHSNIVPPQEKNQFAGAHPEAKLVAMTAPPESPPKPILSKSTLRLLRTQSRLAPRYTMSSSNRSSTPDNESTAFQAYCGTPQMV